jgi:hypothetical protein
MYWTTDASQLNLRLGQQSAAALGCACYLSTALLLQ